MYILALNVCVSLKICVTPLVDRYPALQAIIHSPTSNIFYVILYYWLLGFKAYSLQPKL